MPRSSPRPSTAAPRWALALLVLFGVVLHGSQLGAEFGFGEGNAGSYFGCVAKGYREVGFLATRGAPFMPDLYGGFQPYLHHPPAGFWLASAFGPHEWQLRATTLFAHLVAMLALVGLSRPVLGNARAMLAGALFLVLPVFYIDISASQWPHTIACGLLMLLGFSRYDEGRRWRMLLWATAFLGPWIDWHFGFFCLALVPLAAPWRGLRAASRLLLPGLLAVASLALFVAWRHWAAQAPIWSHPGEGGASNLDLVQGTILTRPPLADQLSGMLRCSALALTWPILVGGLIGLPWFAARAPRLAGALLVAGLLGSLLFGFHVITHTDFPSMLGPAVAVGTASLGGRTRSWIAAGVLVGVAGGWISLARVRASRTTFFRDYGAAATAATRERLEGGGERRFVVASDAWWTYRYYVDSPDFLIYPVADPALIESHRAAIAQQGKGLRFLTLRYAGPPKLPALDAYLDRFPAQRLPQLERSFGERMHIERALLVTIDP